jgi:hypothetical protein
MLLSGGGGMWWLDVDGRALPSGPRPSVSMNIAERSRVASSGSMEISAAQKSATCEALLPPREMTRGDTVV